ncbi:ATP-binding cassette domain-containing protein [Puia sp.]|jgi:molybdate transport system ATP-binding protein|uniref:ATP-binding cassette domain-containing protein n=1 Tax=Puia sp. TaxID=2045100 RepID=UPI002F405649
MAAIFLTLKGVSVHLGATRLLEDLDWTIHRGEQWAVTGPSGSGKTVLAHTLIGTHFYTGTITTATRRISIIEQQHRFRNRPGSTELYYQQRFNASDADQTITVAQELADAGWDGSETPWLDSLHVRQLLGKPLIQLSNGENKRTQLAMAMLQSPELLILDNPFLGLDAEGRATLHSIINGLAAKNIQLLLITSAQEIPDSITHIARLEAGKWTFQGPRSQFQPAPEATVPALDATILARLKQEAQDNAGASFHTAVKMVNTTIRYGEATILDNIQWEVKKGECWNVSGPNGAGKSTLLSLITADNPQAYANEIWLFDRRRGTGESIWDIKKRIGFVSPELHLYFDTGATGHDVVASGLFDTVGLFRTLNEEQETLVQLWMQLLSLWDLRSRRLVQLSTGQQRMILLARALIKNPPMLILDEPCQGLDDGQTERFRTLITALCEAFGTTLIYVSHYSRELPGCINHFLRLEKGATVNA